MSLQLHLHPPIMTRGQGTQEEPDEFPYLNVEFLYLIKRAATPSFHSNLPRNKEREEHILRLLLLKTTTCPSRTLLDPTCRYYFAYYSSSGGSWHRGAGPLRRRLRLSANFAAFHLQVFHHIVGEKAAEAQLAPPREGG